MNREEQLEQENRQLREQIRTLHEQLSQQAELIAQMQQQIIVLSSPEHQKKDSHNSHLPPSSDRLSRQSRTTSLRKKSGKKSGGQIGHEGSRLSLSNCPDEVITHSVQVCAHCQQDLRGVASVFQERRQVIDVPPKRVIIQEHRAEQKCCPHCQQITQASFPPAVRAPVQYGPQLAAIAVYLLQQHLLPYERTRQIIADLIGPLMSVGTLVELVTRCARHLEPVENWIKDQLRDASVLHQDETGLYVQGKRHWMHVSSTERLTHYQVHPKRGKEAVDQAREAGRSSLHPLELHDWNLRYTDLLLSGMQANPLPEESVPKKRGWHKHHPARHLLDRLAKYRGAVLLFATNFAVPFDNSQAERDIRMVKVQQKVSGCFRSLAGAEAFCRIRGYLSSLRKQGLHVLTALHATLLGHPIFPAF